MYDNSVRDETKNFDKLVENSEFLTVSVPSLSELPQWLLMYRKQQKQLVWSWSGRGSVTVTTKIAVIADKEQKNCAKFWKPIDFLKVKGGHANFVVSLQIANPHNFSGSFRNRKSGNFWSASPQIANPQICKTNPQITNPQYPWCLSPQIANPQIC